METWNSPITFAIQQGLNTVDLDVNNLAQGQPAWGNPTGGRVEFSNASEDVSVVPEPTTLIAGALTLLPFAASTLRILRRTRTA